MSVFSDMLSEFQSSPQGAQALQAIQAQGISADDASSLLSHAVNGAAGSMEKQTGTAPQPTLSLFNIFGGHAGREFLAGLVAGVARGDGFLGSLEDGGIAIITGHVAEYVAERAGVSQSMAGTVAAAATPYIMHFAHEKLSAMHS